MTVVDPEHRYCWAVRLEDGTLILMDRDMRILDHTAWQFPGMAYSGYVETLAEYVEWWLDQEWYRLNREEIEAMRRNCKLPEFPDF